MESTTQFLIDGCKSSLIQMSRGQKRLLYGELYTIVQRGVCELSERGVRGSKITVRLIAQHEHKEAKPTNALLQDQVMYYPIQAESQVTKLSPLLPTLFPKPLFFPG